MAMQLDLIGRIENTNLSSSKTLLPLFEAIINSIQAIEDRKPDKGIIKIEFERVPGLFDDLGTNSNEIYSITIIDNGIGFNEDNYKSFNTADTTFKRSKGSKGIGRFLWLKAFQKVEVESFYKNGSTYSKREFTFKLTPKGIEDEKLIETPENRIQTTVRLVGLRAPYIQFCPRKAEAIADKIIEHCLVYFVTNIAPTIQISDPANNVTLILNDIFRDIAKSTLKEVSFELKTHQFKLSILKLFKANIRHELHYFANKRQVAQFALENEIPDLARRLYDSTVNDEFSISAFLVGDYLDTIVNHERTGLNFLSASEQHSLFPNEISESELKEKVIEVLKDELAEYLSVIKMAKTEKVKRFVHEKAPQYKPLLKYKPEILDQIKPGLVDEKLDVELYRFQQGFDYEIKIETTDLFKNIDKVQDLDQYKEKYQDYLTRFIEVGNYKLSQYILHRKIVLEILKKHLKLSSDKKYILEESIHNIIFPLRKTSDDVQLINQNLWLIDEKLNYHQYLASDIRFNKLAPVEIDSQQRPDVIVFNTPFALVSDTKPYQSIVILEFKKPMRKDYSDDENPIDQVLGYVENIIEGKTLDKDGRAFNIPTNTPFYAYIICDISPNLEKHALRRSFIKSTDGLGFFGYINPPLNTYIEIVGYDKLVNDAEKRNQILFDQLNIS